jgi:hypothetical protein
MTIIFSGIVFYAISIRRIKIVDYRNIRLIYLMTAWFDCLVALVIIGWRLVVNG